MNSSQVTTHFLVWYLRSFTLRLMSSVIWPVHPALWMALSMASILVQPWSGMTSGRYVAEKERCFAVRRGRWEDDDSGEGAEDEGGERRDGCGKVIWKPCTPMVQSRYDSPSSKSVSNETLRTEEDDSCSTVPRQRTMRATNLHSRASSSRSSTFLNRASPNALVRAYSARPSRRGRASKLPMQPRSRGARPGREERMFQVTKSGLSAAAIERDERWGGGR